MRRQRRGLLRASPARHATEARRAPASRARRRSCPERIDAGIEAAERAANDHRRSTVGRKWTGSRAEACQRRRTFRVCSAKAMPLQGWGRVRWVQERPGGACAPYRPSRLAVHLRIRTRRRLPRNHHQPANQRTEPASNAGDVARTVNVKSVPHARCSGGARRPGGALLPTAVHSPGSTHCTPLPDDDPGQDRQRGRSRHHRALQRHRLACNRHRVPVLRRLFRGGIPADGDEEQGGGDVRRSQLGFRTLRGSSRRSNPGRIRRQSRMVPEHQLSRSRLQHPRCLYRCPFFLLSIRSLDRLDQHCLVQHDRPSRRSVPIPASKGLRAAPATDRGGPFVQSVGGSSAQGRPGRRRSVLYVPPKRRVGPPENHRAQALPIGECRNCVPQERDGRHKHRRWTRVVDSNPEPTPRKHKHDQELHSVRAPASRTSCSRPHRPALGSAHRTDAGADLARTPGSTNSSRNESGRRLSEPDAVVARDRGERRATWTSRSLPALVPGRRRMCAGQLSRP